MDGSDLGKIPGIPDLDRRDPQKEINFKDETTFAASIFQVRA